MSDINAAGHGGLHGQLDGRRPGLPAPLRVLTSTAGFVLLVAVLWWGSAQPVSAALAGTASFDQLIAAGAAVVAWALAGWVLLVVVITALTAAPGRLGRVALWSARRVAPAAARNLARAAIGLATLGLPYAAATTAGATTVAPATAPVVAPAGAVRLEAAACQERGGAGGELPGVGRPHVARPVVHEPDEPEDARTEEPGDPRTEEPGDPRTEQPPRRPERRPAAVTVERGDTLWGIAARHLGPDATDADIARESARWHAANLHVIGSDPDLIHPGIRLHPPEP